MTYEFDLSVLRPILKGLDEANIGAATDSSGSIIDRIVNAFDQAGHEARGSTRTTLTQMLGATDLRRSDPALCEGLLQLVAYTRPPAAEAVLHELLVGGSLRQWQGVEMEALCISVASEYGAKEWLVELLLRRMHSSTEPLIHLSALCVFALQPDAPLGMAIVGLCRADFQSIKKRLALSWLTTAIRRSGLWRFVKELAVTVPAKLQGTEIAKAKSFFVLLTEAAEVRRKRDPDFYAIRALLAIYSGESLTPHLRAAIEEAQTAEKATYLLDAINRIAISLNLNLQLDVATTIAGRAATGVAVAPQSLTVQEGLEMTNIAIARPIPALDIQHTPSASYAASQKTDLQGMLEKLTGHQTTPADAVGQIES